MAKPFGVLVCVYCVRPVLKDLFLLFKTFGMDYNVLLILPYLTLALCPPSFSLCTSMTRAERSVRALRVP